LTTALAGPGKAAGADGRIGRRTAASIPRKFRSILSLNDFERAARRRLPRPLFGYIRGGVEDESALRGNLASFQDYVFVPRYFAGVAGTSSAVTLFGESWSVPFGIAPMGICAMNGYRADIALARAARRVDMPMIVSGSSLIPLERIVAENPRVWFQAYLPPSPERLAALLDRVRAAGVTTLVVTVDSPVGSNRENNLRSGFSTPLRPSLRLAWDGIVRPHWLVGTFLRTILTDGLPHFENLYAERGVPILSRTVQREFGGRAHFTWEHFSQIRATWSGRLIVKGVLHPADAALAVAAGADGLIVSNHGGRQLDGVIAPLHVLPAICDAAGSVPVMLDGGIRRGTDAVKALGLGAKFVFVGRPFNYAAAVAGEEGVDYAAAILKSEIVRSLAQIGVTRVERIDRAQIVPRGMLAVRQPSEDMKGGLQAR
jgi:L-lactate dehydrogenase (cytochrome)